MAMASSEDQRRLLKDLFQGYDKLMRPDDVHEKTLVTFKMNLQVIIFVVSLFGGSGEIDSCALWVDDYLFSGILMCPEMSLASESPSGEFAKQTNLNDRFG